MTGDGIGDKAKVVRFNLYCGQSTGDGIGVRGRPLRVCRQSRSLGALIEMSRLGSSTVAVQYYVTIQRSRRCLLLTDARAVIEGA